MCWAVPCKISGIIDDITVKVDFGGMTREVLNGFEDVKVGDLVMVHSGVVIGKTTESEIVTNLGLFIEAEKLGLQDLGFNELDAKRTAEQEFRSLLISLQLDPEKYVALQREN
jgi:hydrogenase maturation factor